MESGEHLRQLAPAYELALDLEAQGLSGAELAERLGVPTEALASLLSVAHAKADVAEGRTRAADDRA
jgi:transcriptional regulator with XRE-family HTH domain